MPVMDGYTASRKIREFDTRTPIMALTASATMEMEEKIIQSGMQDFITKPFNTEDLFLKIQFLTSK